MKKKLSDFLKKIKPLYQYGIMIVLLLVLVGACLWLKRPNIAVVDMGRVYQDALVFKQIRTQQTMAEEDWKAQALAQKEALEKADSDLSRKKGRLKKAVFDKRVSELKSNILDFQNQQMAKLDLIRYQATQITQNVEQQIQPFLKQLAQNKNLDLVVSSANVIYYQTDITDEVIEALNDAYQQGLIKDLEIVLDEGE